VVAMRVKQGDATDLEADATRVGLETVLLEVAPGVAEVADAEKGTIFHLMPLSLAPGALVAHLVIRPVPWTVDGLLNAADMPRAEGGCAGGEGVGNVATEAAIGVCPHETMRGLIEGVAVIRQLLTEVRNLLHASYDLGAQGTMADDLSMKGVVAFLPHGPVHSVRVRLLVGEDVLLVTIQGCSGKLICAGVQVFCVDWAAMPKSPQQLGACHVPVDGDVGGDLVPPVAGWDLEHVIDPDITEVFAPPRAWMDIQLRACWRGGVGFGLLFLCDPFDLRIHIALHQCGHNLCEIWRWVQASKGLTWRNCSREAGMEGTGSVGVMGLRFGLRLWMGGAEAGAMLT